MDLGSDKVPGSESREKSGSHHVREVGRIDRNFSSVRPTVKATSGILSSFFYASHHNSDASRIVSVVSAGLHCKLEGTG